MNEANIQIVRKSEIDASVNVVQPSFLESRYVQRDDGDTAAIYLSSHRGCDRACRMCHLTQTGQTDMTPATLDEYVLQAREAFKQGVIRREERGQEAPKRVHYNFMARGEPLLNPTLFNDWEALSGALAQVAEEFYPGIELKFHISTIMSDIYKRSPEGYLVDGYDDLPFKGKYLPRIYYSVYSISGTFRKRWLPKAESVPDALMVLSRYIARGGDVRAHGAFIMMQNDNFDEIRDLCSNLKAVGIKTFNIVRFNSPDEVKMREVDEDYLQGIQQYMEKQGMTVQTINRVGDENCEASCGVFYTPPTE